jgi:uncharacterized protein (TIGR02646 family)
LKEQHFLCAYCQKKIDSSNSSIEHIIPKAFNKELSTSYFNLVAVCEDSIKDPETNRKHCDKERGSKLIPPLILYSNLNQQEKKANDFFEGHFNGKISAKETLKSDVKSQVQSFIDIINSNHHLLMSERRKMIEGLVFALDKEFKRRNFRQSEKHDKYGELYNKIAQDPSYIFRGFLLSVIGKKLGRN